MTNGGALGQRGPFACFCAVWRGNRDAKRAHALTEFDRLREHHAIKRLGGIKLNLDSRDTHIIIGGPVGRGITISQARAGVRRGRAQRAVSALIGGVSHGAAREISPFAIGAIDERTHSDDRVHIVAVNQSAAINRKVEMKVGVVADAALPEIKQLCRSLDLVIFMRVIEPTRANAHIAFSGNPRFARFITFIKTLSARRIVIADAVTKRREHRPTRLSRPTLFIAHPTNVRTNIAEHHRVWLQLAHERMKAREVVDLTLSVGAFAARAVKPHFKDRTVVAQHFAQLRAKIFVVRLARSILRIVAIPRRKVDAELESTRVTRITQFTQHITASRFPRTRRYRVRAQLRRPIAETIVMLGGDDHALDARVFHHAHPLRRIKRAGIEHLRRLITMPPLFIRKRVGAEVDEASELHLLPRELTRGRQGQDRRGRRDHDDFLIRSQVHDERDSECKCDDRHAFH